MNGGPRVKKSRAPKRRAGELYDAFAAGSEDGSEGEYADHEDVDVGGEREKALYDDEEEESPHHVVGDESEDEEEEKKKEDRNALLHK